jgi:VWFA-related protein
MFSKAVCLFTIAILFLHAGSIDAARAQEKKADKDQVVRLKAELFEVRAVVTDKRGKLIDNLGVEDFELLENNRPQRIEFFSKERLPQPAAVPSTANRPGISDSNPSRATKAPGRTVALFVDTLHLTQTSRMRVKQTLRQFIQEQLTDNDLAAVIVSGGQMGLFNQFTRDRRLLLYAVDKLAVGGQAVTGSNFTPYIAAAVQRGEPDALRVALEILRVEENLEVPPRMAEPLVRARARAVLQQAGYWRKAMLVTLRETVKRMADYPGQRIVALVTDGFSLTEDSGSYDTAELNQVISRANASGVVIYSVSAKGLMPPAMSDASNRFPTSPTLFSYLSGSERDLEQGMNALAKDTGGEAFFNSNDMKGLLKKALDNNELYYSLAYYPSSEGEGKDKYRKITLRVKGHPDYNVRAQKGYLASDLKPDPALAEQSPQRRLVQAMVAPLPTTTIGVSVSADFFESDADDRQATVQVHIDAAALEFKQQEGKASFDLDVAVFLIDSAGKLANSDSNTVRGSLTPEGLAVAKVNGLRYTARLALKPGIYQARVGVRENGTERIGTAAALVEIPDLKKNKPTMSGLFISAAEEASNQPAKNDSAWQLHNPTIKRGIPIFKKGGNLVCSFVVYNTSQGETDKEANMQVAIVRDTQVIYQGKWAPLKSNLLQQGKKGMLVGVQIKVAIDPGIYELQITVQDPKSKKPIQQSTLFEVIE